MTHKFVKPQKYILCLILGLMVLSSCRMYSTGRTPLKPHEKMTIVSTTESNVDVNVSNLSVRELSISQLSKGREEKLIVLKPKSKTKIKMLDDTEKLVLENHNTEDIFIQVKVNLHSKGNVKVTRN